MGKPGTWPKGTSGNPNGRPPKNRALTEILSRAGNKTVQYNGGKRKTARKRILADLIWELVTSGQARLADGSILQLDPKDWLGLVKFIYQHIDGSAVQRTEIAGPDGGELIIRYVNDWRYQDDDGD